MKKNISHILIVIVLHLIFFIVGGIILFLYKPHEIVLYVNSLHNHWLDIAMYQLTRLPELAYIVFIILLGLFTQRRYFLMNVVLMLLCLIVIVVSKNLLFADAMRPSVYLNNHSISYYHYLPIEIHTSNSFPSGHTTATFCALVMAALISGKAFWQIVFFMLALFSALSRVYFVQHYFLDIYFGALIGFLLALICYYFAVTKFKREYWQKPIIRL